MCGEEGLNLKGIELRSGVYFLYDKEELVYIGQASNITRRILEHIEQGLKVFDTVRYSLVPVTNLNSVEMTLVKALKPKYNSSMTSNDSCAGVISPNRSAISIWPIVLSNGKHRDGSYNVYLRITFKRRCAYIRTNLRAYEEDLDGCRVINKGVLKDAAKLIKPLEHSSKFISPQMSFEFVRDKLTKVYYGNF